MADKKKLGYSVSKLYEKKGDTLTRKNKSCPKCGAGTFLGKHANRMVCGKCNYAEFTKTK